MQLHERSIEVLFVCLGNICRSPMAEAILRWQIEQAGLGDRIRVDSVGVGSWHVGEPPHRGTQEVLRRNGIPVGGAARQITSLDIQNADCLIAMDRENVADIRSLDASGLVTRKLRRLMEFAPPGMAQDVPDPYFHNNFDEVYRLVEAGCRGLLVHIRKTHHL